MYRISTTDLLGPRPGLAASPQTPFLVPVSDRLKDLQRQRALAQEQLAWLEREIARESGLEISPAPSLPPAPGPQTPAVSPGAPTVAQAAADAEAILAQYRPAPDAVSGNVKRGCYLYFFGALGLLLLGVLAVYFLRSPK